MLHLDAPAAPASRSAATETRSGWVRHALAAFLALVVGPLTWSAAFATHPRPRSEPALPSSAASPGARHEATIPPSSGASGAAPGADVKPPAAGVAGDASVQAPASEACPRDMVLVSGDYCPVVRQDCRRWLDDATLPFARCAEFSEPSRCLATREPLRFCIDRREYVAPGSLLPQNYASFEIASKTCSDLGKRLCSEREWNFACEGEQMLPYPYGYARRPVCNQDRTDLYEQNPHRQVLRDHRGAPGARPECVSPFGVEDMAGNMDEPVRRDEPFAQAPFQNALKGGWWMPARNRCRPATTAHDDFYKDMQVGIRCCAEAT